MRLHSSSLYAAIAAALSLSLHSCASMGTPSGGPRDEDPPRLLRATPAPGAVNVTGQRLELTFDELVNVKDAFSRVTVSPPGGSVPRVTASGRKVYVQFPDTLRAGTTYTIDFGNSIEDVNESNPLGNLSLSFSTGPELDSLRISGVVLDAATLEPQQYVIVGVHPASAPDSAFATLPLERVTKTDDRGRFTLRGLKPIPYSLYALADANNDFRRDSPTEFLAFYPQPVTPHSTQALTTDTIYDMLTGKVDTVVERAYTRFLPDDVLLSMFDEGYKPQYLVKYERPDSARLTFIFNAPASALPEISFINMMDAPAYRVEHSATLDTLSYWLADPRFIQADTLRVRLAYAATDPERRLQERVDTLTLTKPRVRKPKGKRNKEQLAADSVAALKDRLLGVQIRPSGALDIYALPSVEFSEPVLSLDSAGVHLEMKRDSVWTELPRPRLVADTASAFRKWQVRMTPEFGAAYRLTVDSLAVTGIAGRVSPRVKQEFTVKDRDSYSALVLRLVPDSVQGFVEILNSSDKPVQRVRVVDGVASFPWLAPADYYARFVADTDSDMLFTPGNYELRRQPEEVFYYPGVLSLKRHDRSEQWQLYALPVDAQKPRKLLKNKPEQGKRRQPEEEEPVEEDDTFDVNANPFDPKRRPTTPR